MLLIPSDSNVRRSTITRCPKQQKSPKKNPAASKKPTEHPPYSELIKAAIVALKERNSSSRQARGGGWVLPEKLGGGVRPATQNLTPFMTKVCDFPYPQFMT